MPAPNEAVIGSRIGSLKAGESKKQEDLVTFVFGRKRLVISLISDQSDRVLDRYPMAYAATDRELARLNRLGIGAAERVGHDVQRVMHGAGWVR